MTDQGLQLDIMEGSALASAYLEGRVRKAGVKASVRWHGLGDTLAPGGSLQQFCVVLPGGGERTVRIRSEDLAAYGDPRGDAGAQARVEREIREFVAAMARELP